MKTVKSKIHHQNHRRSKAAALHEAHRLLDNALEFVDSDQQLSRIERSPKQENL